MTPSFRSLDQFTISRRTVIIVLVLIILRIGTSFFVISGSVLKQQAEFITPIRSQQDDYVYFSFFFFFFSFLMGCSII